MLFIILSNDNTIYYQVELYSAQ